MSEFFDTRFAEWKEQIDDKIESMLDSLKYSDEFKEVLDYALFPGGKRLRPILALEMHNLYSPPDDYALSYACGLEILHCYSLVHDDMPCMDNDDMRRGKPTVHKMFGEGKALLAGDALMDLAYRVLYAPMPDGSASPFCGFAAATGDCGLINGQYVDLYGKITSLSELTSMYDDKTGALIRIACESGFALGNRNAMRVNPTFIAGETTVEPLDGDDRFIVDGLFVNGFGRALGAAFQLYDDISEYVGGDEMSARNILRYLDLEQSKLKLNKQLNDAAKMLEMLHGDTRYLQELVRKFVIV